MLSWLAYCLRVWYCSHMANTKTVQLGTNPTTFKDLRARLEDDRLGCRVLPANNGHYTVVFPDGRTMGLAHTSVSRRGLLNTVTRLRRRGVCVRRMCLVTPVEVG